MASAPTVSLWHPFTARAVGWPDEDDLPGFHSAPHVAALRDLTAESVISSPEVHYLTDRFGRRSAGDGVVWHYWPRSRRLRRDTRRYRREWSRSALTAERRSDSDITVINTSGHGGPFSRALARVIATQGRTYVAMIGGTAVTATGPQADYYRGAAAVAVHNGVAAASLAAAGLGDRVVTVPLGVDTVRFCPGPADPGPVLLYVGRVVSFKGLPELLAAHAEVLERVPDARLRIVGPTPDADHLATLRRQVDRAGSGPQVEFVGPRAREQLVDEYRRATILVLPSVDEGFGMVVPEAMACGTPVVALDRPGGPAEIIEDTRTGCLVDPAELGTVLVDLLRDPETVEMMGLAAREAAVRRYSKATTAAAFRELVDRAVEHGSSR